MKKFKELTNSEKEPEVKKIGCNAHNCDMPAGNSIDGQHWYCALHFGKSPSVSLQITRWRQNEGREICNLAQDIRSALNGRIDFPGHHYLPILKALYPELMPGKEEKDKNGKLIPTKWLYKVDSYLAEQARKIEKESFNHEKSNLLGFKL